MTGMLQEPVADLRNLPKGRPPVDCQLRLASVHVGWFAGTRRLLQRGN
jgi:hypothetical protein